MDNLEYIQRGSKHLTSGSRHLNDVATSKTLPIFLQPLFLSLSPLFSSIHLSFPPLSSLSSILVKDPSSRLDSLLESLHSSRAEKQPVASMVLL